MESEIAGALQAGKTWREHDLAVTVVDHLPAHVSVNETVFLVEDYESESNVADRSLHGHCCLHHAKRRLASKDHVHHETQTDLLPNGLGGYLSYARHLGQMADKNDAGESANENGSDEASTTLWQAPRQLPSSNSISQIDAIRRPWTRRYRNRRNLTEFTHLFQRWADDADLREGASMAGPQHARQTPSVPE